MRTCSTCGKAAADDEAAFCSACGHALTADPACASCGRDLAPDARFCAYCGMSRDVAPEVVQAPATTGTARKITSVLFGDLVGFTTLSESRDAEEVRELLSAYFEECRAIVSRYGGELEKFIGDAVMAVWGLPVTREDDAERAVRAGLELVEAVTALGDRIGMPGLNMRVGITTAEVAVNLGATGQGMVAGDPVNTAARIQSTAEPGQVWVDETTRNFTASAIAYEDAGSHAMKGKAEPMPLWRVRAVVGGSGGNQRDDLEAPLVGRDGELRLVKEFFHRVQESARPGLLVVDGEAGIGKSRLGWEFFKYIDGFEASVLWHRGRCLSYGEGVAYYALAEAVRGRLAAVSGTDPTEANQDTRQLLHHGLLALVPDDDERGWLEPRIAALLGVESGNSFPREDLFVAWTSFFNHVGRWQSDEQQPVVIVIDDAQYSDEGLVAFLEHLLSAADYPVFVLALARPELLVDHPELVGNRRVTAVHLEPLTTRDMGTLLERLVTDLPASLRDELVERAAGIPLYAIETVRSLVDQGVVESRDGRYVLADPDAVDLAELSAPASLQALISARLDTLPADERQVVDRASVLGLVFTEEGIRALCADVPDLDQALAGLIRRQVIGRETDRLSAEYGDYRFVQGAVRQVAYGMLSRRDRKATHLTVARAFEAELEAHSDRYELAPVIAQHYLDAIDAVPADADVPDLTRAASDQLERAADRAAGLGAPREAAAHLTMALSRCEPERRLGIQSRLARQLRIAGEYDRAIEHATEALKAFDANGDVLGAVGPAEDLARSLLYSDRDYDRAERELTEHLDQLPDEPATLAARLSLTLGLSTLHLRRGNSAELERVSHDGMVLAENLGDPRSLTEAMANFASSRQASMPLLSATLFQRVIELAGEGRMLRGRALALINLTSAVTYTDMTLAEKLARDAVAAAREIGDAYVAAYATGNLAVALLTAGGWDEAQGLAAVDDLRTFLPDTAEYLIGSIAYARGEQRPAPAVDTEHDGENDNAVRRAEFLLNRVFDAQATGSRADVAAGLDALCSLIADMDPADIWAIWMAASEIGRALGSGPEIAALLSVVDARNGVWPAGIVAQRCRLEAVTGQDGSLSDEEIEQRFRQALETARTWGSTLYEAHFGADYGTWLTRQDRAEEAAPLLVQARTVYERIGAQRWLDALDSTAT